MNATATLALAPSAGRGRAGLSVGWSLSLLVHTLVVAWLLHAPAPRAPEAAPAVRIEVRLSRPAPASAPAPAVEPAPAKAAPRTQPEPAADAIAEPTPARPARARRAPVAPAPSPAYETRPAPARATPDTNEQPLPTPSTAGEAAASAPTVDIASARQAARLIAREARKATVALPARKPVVDPNADRQVIDPIEAARKPDCKSAYAGAGILALIPLAASAVIDTGCKW